MRKLTLIFYVLLLLFLYKLNQPTHSPNHSHRFTIYRDNDGIPHVYAKRQLDLFYGLG